MMSKPTISVSNTSYIVMTAKEVLLLAEQSLLDIEAGRQRFVEQALQQVSTQRCDHLFGLTSHQRYRTREEALRLAPEVAAAKLAGYGDWETCEQLKKVAKYLLEHRPAEEQVIHVSLNDFRALT